jgi:beta-lactam-binding protein with PASTA domain
VADLLDRGTADHVVNGCHLIHAVACADAPSGAGLGACVDRSGRRVVASRPSSPCPPFVSRPARTGGAAVPTVPFVTGLLLTDAVNSIAGAGLGVGFVSSAISSEVAAGAALSTDPPGGTEVGPGQLISIVLSDGPPEQPPSDLFVVPDVLGFRFEEAEATLQGAGWTVTVTKESSADEDFGLIIRQEPPGGSLGPQPGNVAIALSRGSPPTPPKPPDQPLVE